MKGILKEFREFAFKGNMLDLAIGFIIGAAFSAVVNSLAKDVIMNVVAAIFGKPDFSKVVFHVGKGSVGIGILFTAIVNFLIIAFVLFLIIKAVNKSLPKPKPVEAKKTRACPYCLTAIPLAATKCHACTSSVDPETVPAAG